MNKSINKDNIHVLVLSLGVNLVAQIDRSDWTDSEVTVEHPMAFIHVRGEEGYFGFDKWQYYVNSSRITINRDHIVAKFKPTDDMINAYVKFFDEIAGKPEPTLELLDSDEEAAGEQEQRATMARSLN